MALTRARVVRKYLHGTSVNLCIPYSYTITDFVFVVNALLEICEKNIEKQRLLFINHLFLGPAVKRLGKLPGIILCLGQAVV